MNAAIREARDSGMIGRRSGPAPHEAAAGGAPASSKLSAKPGALTEALWRRELAGKPGKRACARPVSVSCAALSRWGRTG